MVRVISIAVFLVVLVSLCGCRKHADGEPQVALADDTATVAQLALAKKAVAQEKWDEVLNQATQILDTSPHCMEALYLRGLAKLQNYLARRHAREDVEEAQMKQDAQSLADIVVPDFTKVIEHDPRHVAALAGRASALRTLVLDYDRAIADADAALACDPQYAEALYQRGAAYGAKADKESRRRARVDIDEFIRRSPQDYRGHAVRGSIRKDDNDWAGARADFTRTLELKPDDILSRAFRAQAHAVLGDFRQATADFEELTRRTSKVARVAGYQGLFSVFVAQDRIDQAVAIIDQAIAVDASLAAYLLQMRGEVYYHRCKDYVKAIDDFTRFLSAKTGTVQERGDAHYDRGVCFARLNRGPEARDDFTATLALRPNDPHAFHDRAIILFEAKNLRAALADCDQSLRLKPGQSEMHALRALCHQGLGNLDAALADFDRAAELGCRPPILYVERAGIYLQRKQFAKSLADADEAIRLDPKDDYAFQTRAMAHLGLGNKDKALADYAESGRLNPKNPNSLIVTSMLTRDQNHARSAIASLEKLAPESERSALWYFQRSALWMSLKEWDKARQDCDRVLALDPAKSAARLNRANCLLSMGQYDEALAECDKLLRLETNAADAWSTRGLVHLQQKKFGQALEDFHNAVRHGPDQGQIYINRALAWDGLGEPAKALEDRLKAIELSNDNCSVDRSGLVYVHFVSAPGSASVPATLPPLPSAPLAPPPAPPRPDPASDAARTPPSLPPAILPASSLVPAPMEFLPPPGSR